MCIYQQLCQVSGNKSTKYRQVDRVRIVKA